MISLHGFYWLVIFFLADSKGTESSEMRYSISGVHFFFKNLTTYTFCILLANSESRQNPQFTHELLDSLLNREK